jgi:hypothetical protein
MAVLEMSAGIEHCGQAELLSVGHAVHMKPAHRVIAQIEKPLVAR